MTAQVEFEVSAPPFHWDEAGGIRIAQSRVTLDSLLAAYQQGATPEEIAVQYPVLSLGDIYATISYYLNHRQAIDTYLAQRQQNAEQHRQQFVQQHNLADLRQRLRDRAQVQCKSPDWASH
ncbi:DUF433 domain-containing protein [Trichothermofontia sp.]